MPGTKAGHDECEGNLSAQPNTSSSSWPASVRSCVPSATHAIQMWRSTKYPPIRRWSVERESLFCSERKRNLGLRRARSGSSDPLQPNRRRDTIGIHMKKLILATVLAGIATSALAADLGARTYSKAPVMVEQVYNWTGFYIGGDIGGANVAGRP